VREREREREIENKRLWERERETRKTERAESEILRKIDFCLLDLGF
jgi:hypothetical protein